MASRSSSRARSQPPHSSEGDSSLLSNALTAVTNSNISTFSRKVTSTAGSLISPFSETLAPENHYHNAMTAISKDLRRPTLQKRVFSFSNRTPSELVRSKLSTTEIQYRALTYLPDDLLKDIPESNSSYSLFQGFQASIDLTTSKKSQQRRKSESKGLLESGSDAPGGTISASSLSKLTKERSHMSHQLDLLGIRKNIASSEIREIDVKLANLNAMRALVLERLAKLEQEESQHEHDLLELDNRIEDMQYDLEENAGVSLNEGSEDDGQMSEAGGFMSESIYGKLPSPKNRKQRVPHKRKSMPILHEHMEPGTNIKELQSHTEEITALDFDYPFGTMVTAARDDTVRVWDLNSGRCLGMLEGHRASVRCLQVEENFVATGSMDATIRFWDLSRAEYVSQPSPRNGKKASAPTSEDGDDDDDFSMFSNRTEQVSSIGTQECHLVTLDAHIGEVTALHFQGRNLVSGSADKTLRQWDLEAGRCIQTLDVLWAAAQSVTATLEGTSTWSEGQPKSSNRAQHGEADFVGALQCFDAALACGTADGMVRLWDLRSGQVHRSLVGHTGPVTALQFDDMHLVTGSLDRSIRIWDLRTGSISDAFAYENPITSMQFDPRRIVSAAGESVAKVYDRADGRHWDCGAGTSGKGEGRLSDPAIVQVVKCREGYLVEGRRDGVIGVWTC